MLRLFRLGKIPSSLHSSEILSEHGFPVLAVEYGNISERVTHVEGPFPRLRLACPSARFVPHRIRTALILFLTLLKLIIRVFIEGRPRLIIAHGLQEQWVALCLNRIFEIPYGVHVHEGYDLNESLTPLNRWLFRREKRALCHAQFLIFSEAMRAQLYRERYQFQCPVFIAFNAPRLRRVTQTGGGLRKQLAIPDGAAILGYLGGLGDFNLIEEGVRALAGIPNVHFVLCGWSTVQHESELKKVAAEVGVSHRFHLLGEVEDKWSVIRECDFGYCLYSPHSFRTRNLATASNKLLEFVAAGVPVLTSSNPDFRAFVERYQIGVCAPDLTIAGIRDGLHALVFDVGGRERKRAAGLFAHQNELNYETQFAPLIPYLAPFFPGVVIEKSISRSA